MIAIVGEAPPRWNVPPMTGSTGMRLAKLMIVEDVHSAATCLNLYRTPRKTWHAENARGMAQLLAPTLERHRVVLLLGRRVQKAFDFERVKFFDPMPREATAHVFFGTTLFYVMPHPSGLNRWWNHRTNIAFAQTFFEALRDQLKLWQRDQTSEPPEDSVRSGPAVPGVVSPGSRSLHGEGGCAP